MPGPVVVETAMMQCTFGAAPMPLNVTMNQTVRINGLAVATIMDMAPIVNIPPFGVCAELTAIALGVPTPCVPATVAPWTPGSALWKIPLPVLTMPALCQCAIGGTITIIEPGQVAVESF